MKGGFGKKGGVSAEATSRGKGAIGEIRYDNPLHAQMAVAMLNGSAFNGGMITVNWDMNSKDGTKLIVEGIPPGTEWQELKDHFAQMGTVAFAGVKGAAKGKGKGGDVGGGFGGCGGMMMGGMNPMQGMMMNMGMATGSGNGEIGEIRYDDPMHAQMAVSNLN